MRTNRIIREILFLATFCVFSKAQAAVIQYAIDDSSCLGPQQDFLDAKIRRVRTIAKFMSLNLGSSVGNTVLENPQEWHLDGFVEDLLKLTMGDTQDATSQAQWLYGGAYGMSGTGLAGISSKIDKNKAGPYDVVMYCDPSRLGLSIEAGKVLDLDATAALGRDVILDKDFETGCTAAGGQGAPAYIFSQVSGDAARITFCPWYLTQAMNSETKNVPSDTRRLPQYLQQLYTYFGSKLWAESPKGLPSLNDFQLFDGIMISALTHMRTLGSREPTPRGGVPAVSPGGTVRGSLTTWADVLSAATNSATRYTSGAYVYLLLAVFAYRSGFSTGSDGQLNGFLELAQTDVGKDWGDPNQLWVSEWQGPFQQPS